MVENEARTRFPSQDLLCLSHSVHLWATVIDSVFFMATVTEVDLHDFVASCDTV